MIKIFRKKENNYKVDKFIYHDVINNTATIIMVASNKNSFFRYMDMITKKRFIKAQLMNCAIENVELYPSVTDSYTFDVKEINDEPIIILSYMNKHELATIGDAVAESTVTSLETYDDVTYDDVTRYSETLYKTPCKISVAKNLISELNLNMPHIIVHDIQEEINDLIHKSPKEALKPILELPSNSFIIMHSPTKEMINEYLSSMQRDLMYKLCYDRTTMNDKDEYMNKCTIEDDAEIITDDFVEELTNLLPSETKFMQIRTCNGNHGTFKPHFISEYLDPNTLIHVIKL